MTAGLVVQRSMHYFKRPTHYYAAGPGIHPNQIIGVCVTVSWNGKRMYQNQHEEREGNSEMTESWTDDLIVRYGDIMLRVLPCFNCG